MARVYGKLAAIRAAQLVRERKVGLHGDGGGLGLRISRTGAASWVFRYMRQVHAHELGIGPTHTLTLSEARERARRLRQSLLDGIDPLAQRAAVKAPPPKQ